MWTAPSRLLPKASEVVVAIDDDGPYHAMRARDEPDSEWLECTAYGDPIFWDENQAVIREPLYWCHVPRDLRKS